MSKIFGKIKRGKIIFALLFVVMITSLIIALAGCSYYNKYGKEKAYNTTSSSAIIHAPSSVKYYIDTSVTGNYKTAAKYAINEANELTDAVTITYSTSKSYANSSFVIKVANLGASDSNAVNNILYIEATGEITASTITLNSYYMKDFELGDIKHIVLHEVGHTFGLSDLEFSDDKKNAKAAKYSVMYYTYSTSSKYTYTDYQEFDKKNISWYYD